MSTGELIAGLVGASVTRAVMVGFAVWLAMLLWPGVSVDVRRPELVIWFGLMGSLLLAFLGLLTSIWAEKFDHAAAVTNFVVTPLSLLSGTFYSVTSSPRCSRRSATPTPSSTSSRASAPASSGVSDSPLAVGAIGLLVLNVALWAACYALLKSGWKIKN